MDFPMSSDKTKDKKIISAILKSESMDVVGRGTLTLDPKEITKSPKYNKLLKSISETIKQHNKKVR